MKLSEIGEFALIEKIGAMFRPLLPKGFTGIGDDCAVLPKSGSHVYVISCDMLIENVHFYKNKISPEDLGFKALAVNLSDIAAMGGAAPSASFLSLALSGDTDAEWTEKFLAGYRELSAAAAVPLCGGDTSAAPHAVISVTVVGTGQRNKLHFRNQAMPGDAVCCTGSLGDSAGGFRLLRDNLEAAGEDEAFLLESHLRPEPELKAGRILAGLKGVRAMTDISDGLISNLSRLIEASGCGAAVETEKLPISDRLKRASNRFGWNPEDLALNGGEDYRLLFTADPKKLGQISDNFGRTMGRPIYVLGRIEEGRAIRLLRGGAEIKNPGKIFSHF